MSSSVSCLCLREERETTRRSVVQVLHKEIHHDDGHKGEEHGDDVDHEAGGPVALSRGSQNGLGERPLAGLLLHFLVPFHRKVRIQNGRLHVGWSMTQVSQIERALSSRSQQL